MFSLQDTHFTISPRHRWCSSLVCSVLTPYQLPECCWSSLSWANREIPKIPLANRLLIANSNWLLICLICCLQALTCGCVFFSPLSVFIWTVFLLVSLVKSESAMVAELIESVDGFRFLPLSLSVLNTFGLIRRAQKTRMSHIAIKKLKDGRHNLQDQLLRMILYNETLALNHLKLKTEKPILQNPLLWMTLKKRSRSGYSYSSDWAVIFAVLRDITAGLWC